MCGIFLSLAAAAEVVSLPSGSVKNIEYTNSKAPAYLAFDAVINTNGKYTAGGAWGLAVRLNNNALLASELVNKPFSINYNKGKLYYIDDNGRLFLPYTGNKRLSKTFVFKLEGLAQAGKNTLQLTNIYDFYAKSQVEISNLRWLNALPAAVVPQVKNQRLEGFISIPLGGKKVITVEKNSGNLPYLAFSGRISTDKWRSGAQPALIIRINGQSLRLNQLKNKSSYFHYRADSRLKWVADDRIYLGYYLLHKVSRTIDAHFIHDFVFDLSGLWHKDAPNTIELENIFAAFPGSSVEIFDLRLTDNNFLRSPQVNEPEVTSFGAAELRKKAEGMHKGVTKMLDTVPESTAVRQPINFVPQQSAAIPVKVSQEKSGIKFSGSENLHLNTVYSVHNQPTVLKNNSLQTKQLSVERKLLNTPNGVIVYDKLTNRTNKDLPVVCQYGFKLDLEKLKEFRIAGEAQTRFIASTNNYTLRKYSQTPLIYLGLQKGAFGIYLTDDVLRNQYSVFTVDDTLYISDDIFYLQPQQSYTISFRIYPVNGNYYDCLNILRKDLNLYQEIPGLFGFVYKMNQDDFFERYYRQKLDTPEKIRKFFATSGISIPAATGSPMLYGSEKSSEWQKSLQAYNKFKKDVIAAQAPVKAFLHYCDVHLVAVNNKKDLDGKTMWQQRLQDSVLLDDQGYTVPYRSGKLYLVVPTLENSAGKQIKENIAHVLNNHPTNGIFFDEFNHSRARIAWNMSDKYSALLDKNGNIARKFAIVPLKSHEFLLDIARFALQKNSIAYANQFDCTLPLMQLPLIHFAEPVAHEESYLIRAAQASRTPLTLSCKRNTTVWSDIKYFLQYGVAVCYYASRSYGDHLLQKLYPLTIYEAQAGVIYGKDKILTSRSGSYKLPGAKMLTIYIYRDPEGMLAEKRTCSGDSVDLKLNPASEVALIIADSVK